MNRPTYLLLAVLAVGAVAYGLFRGPATGPATSVAPPPPAPVATVPAPEPASVPAPETTPAAAAVPDEPAPATAETAAEESTAEEQAVVAEAKAYLEALVAPTAEAPLELAGASRFVTPTQPIAPLAVRRPAPAATSPEPVVAEAGQPVGAEAPERGAVPLAAPEPDPAVTAPASGPGELQQARTVVELVELEGQVARDSLFYVRTVRESDIHGVWGIIQQGLMENFARGVLLEHGGQTRTVQVAIPADADEIREDRSSSFLGRLIHRKTVASYVYNLRQQRMGRNPHRLRPGQEIVIIHFDNRELVEIYRHFSGRGGIAAVGEG